MTESLEAVEQEVEAELEIALAEDPGVDVIVDVFIAAGKVTPVIDRAYRLEETAEAVRYVETGQARGKVVIPV